MVFPRTLCDDISSSDFRATDKASFSFSFSFLCLATAITGLAFFFLVVAVAFPLPWITLNKASCIPIQPTGSHPGSEFGGMSGDKDKVNKYYLV
ncbi:hypothetical protein AVEN_31854-1 [Araneus ventricosus]|uniref:Uncharacterized protein n=1 Tax=Araneus ventricosus TaxID=182803 RepID=A0A4Y2F9T7_ARAVE|nr:hypothetical protein AVEN_31854-1 [Araneus ventricosus]